MTTKKILRALEKAALTNPKDAEEAAFVFMDAISPLTLDETYFDAAFFCAVPNYSYEEKLVRGWLQEACTLKYKRDKLLEIFTQTRVKTQRQYRAELRKLAERIKETIEGDEP